MRATRIIGPKYPLHIRYQYNKEDKTSVYRIAGSRKDAFRIPNGPTSLNYTQRYLNVQIRLKSTDSTTITITLADDKNNHFNFAFATAMRSRPSSSQMCALVSLNLPKDQWVNICFDLEQIAQKYWPSGSYHFLDAIEISPYCFVRWIFIHSKPITEDGANMPAEFEFPRTLPYQIVSIPESTVSTRRSLIPTRSSQGRNSLSAKNPSTTTKPLRANQTFLQDISAKSIHPTHSAGIQSIPHEEAAVIEEEEDESDDGAFSGTAPKADQSIPNIHSSLPENEEEELELVYIEALGCYYCPSNQQYYQLDE